MDRSAHEIVRMRQVEQDEKDISWHTVLAGHMTVMKVSNVSGVGGKVTGATARGRLVRVDYR